MYFVFYNVLDENGDMKAYSHPHNFLSSSMYILYIY